MAKNPNTRDSSNSSSKSGSGPRRGGINQAARRGAADAQRTTDDATEISREQGTHRDTPQREHERERIEPRPNKPDTNDAIDEFEDIPTERPPRRHGLESEIDDSGEPR